MPESKGRSKRVFTPPSGPTSQKVNMGNPSWFVPLMCALMIVGLLWTATFYISGQQYPIPNVGRWNVGIGFALILAGFAMTTRWR